jgi:hypothetical protein
LFSIGTAAVAADDSESSGTTVASTTLAEIPEFPTSAGPISAQSHAAGAATAGTRNGAAAARDQKDGRRRADAKANKGAEVAAPTLAESQPEPVVGLQDQICKSTPMTGTRLRKQVCISAAQQEANNRYQERQAQDYLRMLSEQALRAPEHPSPFISVNPGF